jgi:hypothetical protein
MLTYSKIGKKGNLGNQLFQIASTIGLANKNNLEFGFLDWKYQNSFINKLPTFSCSNDKMTVVEEKYYNYYDWNLEKNQYYDLSGWLQTEKYFDIALTKHYFQFKENFINGIREKYSKAFSKKTILLSIRRGDFINHKDYFQTSIKYYLNSLEFFFPDWESNNLIILSDDINYCKFHFSFLNNTFFGDGLSAIEQLCLGSLCDDFIIGNSTFSWWSAWLGEKKNSKIIRPLKNFIGDKSLESDDKDYFPERWIKYNHLNDKIKLNNIDFYIKSNKNRIEIKNYILYYFDVKVEINPIKIENYNDVYFFEVDYILPPILMLYSSRIKNRSLNSFVNNNVIEVFNVSKFFNYIEFTEQNDFGIFSNIFNFPIRVKIKIFNSIYLTNKLFLKNTNQSNKIIINCKVGRFKEIGGYKFTLKRIFKKVITNIKSQIKIIIRFKK